MKALNQDSKKKIDGRARDADARSESRRRSDARGLTSGDQDGENRLTTTRAHTDERIREQRPPETTKAQQSVC
jgi:hypothetical protein